MKTRYNPFDSRPVALPRVSDPPPAAPAKRQSKPRKARGAATSASAAATRRPKPVSADAAAALERATTQASMANYPAIIAGFIAKGIPESEIKPRENVFTFKAWRALGRIVRKGEHGVKIGTMIPVGDPEETVDPNTGEVLAEAPRTRPWTTTVFHISQTDPISSDETRPSTPRSTQSTRSTESVNVVRVEFTPPAAPGPVALPPVVSARSTRPTWRERYAQRTEA